MFSKSASAGSWITPNPPASVMVRSPEAPSSRLPESTTPTTRAPRSPPRPRCPGAARRPRWRGPRSCRRPGGDLADGDDGDLIAGRIGRLAGRVEGADGAVDGRGGEAKRERLAARGAGLEAG